MSYYGFCSIILHFDNNRKEWERYESERARQFHGIFREQLRFEKGRKKQFVARHARGVLVSFEDSSSFWKGSVGAGDRAYCGSCRVFVVLGALFVRKEREREREGGSVMGTSSASLILAHRAGAWLSTIGALCKYRLQPHQLRVQLAELGTRGRGGGGSSRPV